jgi:uncharacterized protein (UPF0332 family)
MIFQGSRVENIIFDVPCCSGKKLLFIRDIYPKSHKGVIHKIGEEFIKSGLLERKTL